mgnify:CR=1 FL=1
MDWQNENTIQSEVKNLLPNDKDSYKRHISTHSKYSVEDHAAVSTLNDFFISGGKINPDFSYCDRWPNHDGTFEFVPNPDISRCPEQVFMVQIKGTSNYRESEGIISCQRTSLAFPAFIANEVTADPGILFIVLDPERRGDKRVFWRYLSPSFIRSIDFEKGSATIKLRPEDEIKNTDESIDQVYFPVMRKRCLMKTGL